MVLRQYIVAGASLLAALPVGCSLAYPGILLQQLSSNNSTIELDPDTASWIGAIHGIAGIPSIIMPVFIQWRGRRLGIILACLLSIIGWILSYTATSSTCLLISESFNGFGSQSISAATSFSMSEMLSPRIRRATMGIYLVIMTLGMTMVQIAGGYLHWRTVSLVVCIPLIVTALAACMWPESPSWLAYKGEFSKCTKAFTLLRGTDELAQAELEELVLAQKENLLHEKESKKNTLKSLFKTMRSKDFILPNLHILVLMMTSYWSGAIAHIIYASDIIERATNSKDAVFMGCTIFNASMFVVSIISTFLIQYIQPKKILLSCISGVVVFLLCASGINYAQDLGYVSKESYISLYFLIAYMISYSFGIPILVPMTSELIPVKYRGLAGPFQVIFPCMLHTTALKAVPYMLRYLNLWGMLLVFATNAALCTLFTWYFIPETRGRTLQQLEDYYNYGNFDKCRRANAEKVLSELLPEKC